MNDFQNLVHVDCERLFREMFVGFVIPKVERVDLKELKFKTNASDISKCGVRMELFTEIYWYPMF